MLECTLKKQRVWQSLHNALGWDNEADLCLAMTWGPLTPYTKPNSIRTQDELQESLNTHIDELWLQYMSAYGQHKATQVSNTK